MRIRIIIEVDTGMKRSQFNAEVLKKIASCEWPVVYLATEDAEDKHLIMINHK